MDKLDRIEEILAKLLTSQAETSKEVDKTTKQVATLKS